VAKAKQSSWEECQRRLSEPKQRVYLFRIAKQMKRETRCYRRNVYERQFCSQGQNPKAKDEAKARTLKARPRPGLSRRRPRPVIFKAEAWTLETMTKARALES